MISWALDSLAGLRSTRMVFVVLREHEEQFGVSAMLRGLAGPDIEIVLLDAVTEGQLCTVLAARRLIEPNEELLIASSDTYVLSELAVDISQSSPECRGLISVATMPGDRWSFAGVDAAGEVVEVAEKVRISDHASTGLYYFKLAGEFLEAADEIVQQEQRTKGEFYVMPVYRKYIERGWRTRISLAREMWDLGTPDALRAFEEHLQGVGIGLQ
jgi:dTDP-glucose pyrophosphorylase